MKKTIVCYTTSNNEIVNAAKEYFLSEGYEIQDIITENGEIGIQARKTSWLRKCSGTSYAMQVIVKEHDNYRYEITAGWGEWLSKGTVVFVATFIAFGFLLIPAVVGMVNQKNLPQKCLDYTTNRIKTRHPLCRIYNQAK